MHSIGVYKGRWMEVQGQLFSQSLRIQITWSGKHFENKLPVLCKTTKIMSHSHEHFHVK